jgi:hypothetical protein
MVKCVAIGRSAGPWLKVGKVDGGAPSDKVASADRVSVGQSAKGVVCVSHGCVECTFPWCTAWLCSSMGTSEITKDRDYTFNAVHLKEPNESSDSELKEQIPKQMRPPAWKKRRSHN